MAGDLPEDVHKPIVTTISMHAYSRPIRLTLGMHDKMAKYPPLRPIWSSWRIGRDKEREERGKIEQGEASQTLILPNSGGAVPSWSKNPRQEF